MNKIFSHVIKLTVHLGSCCTFNWPASEVSETLSGVYQFEICDTIEQSEQDTIKIRKWKIAIHTYIYVYIYIRETPKCGADTQ